MTSNALSTGAGSRKLPGICKPPPWPPAVPPPPIAQAKFWCFADIDDRSRLGPITYGATCFCIYKPDLGYWEGYSGKDFSIPQINVILWVHGDPVKWGAIIDYWWPGSVGWGWEFDEQLMPEGRPYNSSLAQEISYRVPGRVIRITTCVTREVPS